jgi:hypothetical protein
MTIGATFGVLALGFGAIGLAQRMGRPMWSLGGIGLIVIAAVLWSLTTTLSPRSSDEKGATVYQGAGREFLDSLAPSTFDRS